MMAFTGIGLVVSKAGWSESTPSDELYVVYARDGSIELLHRESGMMSPDEESY